MNAVKNCLVVLAAAVALASCSADPTSSLAGKNVTISATPGSVAIRAGQTAEVFASATDALGGAVDGKFTVTPAQTDTTIYTVRIDTSYTPVTGGARPATRTRIVVTAKKEINSSFTISGTGGSLTVPLRIGPDSLNFNVTFTSTAVGLANLDTATAPVGIRFTGATQVSFSGSNGSFTPAVIGFSADSTQVYFLPPINAHGKVFFTNVVNTVTPTIAYSAFSRDTVLAPVVPFPGSNSSASLAPSQVDTITITDPQWHFTAASNVTNSINGFSSIVLGFSADSLSMYVVPAPGPDTTAKQLVVTNITYSTYPGRIITIPTANNVSVPKLVDLGGDDPAGPVPTFNLPTLGNYGWWDVGSFTANDNSADGAGPGSGINSQVYKLNLGVNATNVISTVSYSFGRDIDLMMLAGDTTTNTTYYGGFNGTVAKNPEIQKSGPLTAGSYMLDLIDWGPGFGPGNDAVGATLQVILQVQ